MEGLKLKPQDDRTAIFLILDGLTKLGYQLVSVIDDTWNPEDVTRVSTVEEAVNLVTGVDVAFVRINLPDSSIDPTGKTSDAYIYFVLGNAPEEVACDYTTNLDPDLSNITLTWWE